MSSDIAENSNHSSEPSEQVSQCDPSSDIHRTQNSPQRPLPLRRGDSFKTNKSIKPPPKPLPMPKSLSSSTPVMKSISTRNLNSIPVSSISVLPSLPSLPSTPSPLSPPDIQTNTPKRKPISKDMQEILASSIDETLRVITLYMQSYTDKLGIISNNWIKPLYAKTKRLPGHKAVFETIFFGIEEIHAYETKRLQILNQEDAQFKIERCISKELVEWLCVGSKLLDIYKKFQLNFPNILTTYVELTESRAWKAWNFTVQSKIGGNLTDFLFIPMAHLHKLDVFIKIFVKLLDKVEDTEYQKFIFQLTRAESVIHPMVDEGNVNILKRKMKLHYIQEALISHVPIHVFSPHRQVIFDSALDFKLNGYRKEGHVYLMNDAILLVKTFADGTRHFVDIIDIKGLSVHEITPNHNEGEVSRLKKSQSSTKVLLNNPDSDNIPYNVDSLVAPGNYIFKIENTVPISDIELKLDIRENIYKRDYIDQQHVNFINVPVDGEEHFVYSVLTKPDYQSGLYRALKSSLQGTKEITFKVNQKDGVLAGIQQAITGLEDRDVYIVTDNSFPSELSKLEEKHPQEVSKMKMGVVYCKAGETDPQNMFNVKTKYKKKKNMTIDECSPEFWEFMNTMGHKIDLKGWNKYKGDMGSSGVAYYDVWKNIELIYHVAPLMDSEGHRRLIGNDICIIIFIEQGVNNLDLSLIGNFGQVPQSWVLVQPLILDGVTRYRVNFFSRESMGEVYPNAPSNYLLDKQSTKNLILTKLYNAQVKTQYVQPFCRFFRLPRTDTLSEIIGKFPIKKMKKNQVNAVFGSTEVRIVLSNGTNMWEFYSDSNENTTMWLDVLNSAINNYGNISSEILQILKPIVTPEEVFPEEDLYEFLADQTDSNTLKKFEVVKTGGNNKRLSSLSNNFTRAKSQATIRRSGVLSNVGKATSYLTKIMPLSRNAMEDQTETDPTALTIQLLRTQTLRFNTIKYPSVINFSLKILIEQNKLGDFRDYLSHKNMTDLLSLYVDIYNFVHVFYVDTADVINHAQNIINNWFKSDNPIIKQIDPIRLPNLSIDITPSYFDQTFIGLEALIENTYMSSTRTPIDFNQFTSQEPPGSRRFPRTFTGLKSMQGTIPIFYRYLKEIKFEDVFSFYLQIHNFREQIYLSEADIKSEMDKILEYIQNNQYLLDKAGVEEDICSIETKKSVIIFDSLFKDIQASLNKQYCTLMEIYKELKLVDKRW